MILIIFYFFKHFLLFLINKLLIRKYVVNEEGRVSINYTLFVWMILIERAIQLQFSLTKFYTPIPKQKKSQMLYIKSRTLMVMTYQNTPSSII